LEKTKNFLIDSVYNVWRLLILGLGAGILILLSLFSVDVNFKNYDLFLTSKLKSGLYYGIEYSKNLELWKIERSEDGSLYTQRLYP